MQCKLSTWNFISHCDRAVTGKEDGSGKVDTGYAAIAGASHTPASFRAGFDMSTALRPQYKWTVEELKLIAEQPDRKRSTLLSFKGALRSSTILYTSTCHACVAT